MTCACPKPNRSYIRHFKARDVGRIITYARRDGAEDAELLANILAAFGRKDLACLIYRVIDVLNTSAFLGALIAMLSGLITVLKGLKLVRTLKRGTIPGLLELIVPAKYLGSLGAFYIWVGGVTASMSALVVFLTAIQNNVALYLLARSTCETKVEPFELEQDPIELGSLPAALYEALVILESEKSNQ